MCPPSPGRRQAVSFAQPWRLRVIVRRQGCAKDTACRRPGDGGHITHAPGRPELIHQSRRGVSAVIRTRPGGWARSSEALRIDELAEALADLEERHTLFGNADRAARLRIPAI